MSAGTAGPVRIALLGDRRDSVVAHGAIPMALNMAAAVTGSRVETEWIPTEAAHPAESVFASFDGVWCVPGSPYADMEGALAGIRYARTRPLPFLGSCGGFQHALIEFYRNALGLTGADHAESNPEAEMPLIAPLTCSLVGKTGTVRFEPGSRIGAIYGAEEAAEPYHCSYGINPAYLAALQGSGLRIGARDEQGEVRSIEMEGHPFFLATLYQPERSALEGRTHPLIVAYLRAAQAARSPH